MKKCPACGTQYSDDTLLYCLQDGTSLESVFITETPTVVLDEVETAPRAARVNTPSPAGERRSSVPIAVVVTAFAMLLLFGVAGLAAWMFLKSKQLSLCLI